MIEQLFMASLLLSAILFIAFTLYKAHKNPNKQFDLTDLITYKGRVDNSKFCQMGAFFISSWVVFYMVLKGTITEWAYGLYMAAWVGARVASMMTGLKASKVLLEGEK